MLDDEIRTNKTNIFFFTHYTNSKHNNDCMPILCKSFCTMVNKRMIFNKVLQYNKPIHRF